jgi:hypothetical protein
LPILWRVVGLNGLNGLSSTGRHLDDDASVVVMKVKDAVVLPSLWNPAGQAKWVQMKG